MDFVVGHPRSGTGFSSHLLACALGPNVAHEHLEQVAGYSRVAIATVRYRAGGDATELRELLCAYDRAPIAVDSIWRVTWFLPLVREKFPQAKVVHLVRNPAECVRACFNLDYYGPIVASLTPEALQPALAKGGVAPPIEVIAPVLADYQTTYATFPRIGDDWDRLSQLEKNCAFWNETHRLIEEAGSSFAAYKRVRLEDLTEDLAAVHDLFDFLGAPRPADEMLRGMMGSPVNTKPGQKLLIASIKKDLLRPYPQWTAPQKETLARLCGERALRYGYDLVA
jgi:hypothetical protein